MSGEHSPYILLKNQAMVAVGMKSRPGKISSTNANPGDHVGGKGNYSICHMMFKAGTL